MYANCPGVFNKKASDLSIERLGPKNGYSLFYCLLSDPKYLIKDRSKDIHRVIRTISVLRPAVISVLIAALESLLEIVLVLAAVYIRIITIASLIIGVITVVITTPAVLAIHLTLTITLLVTSVNRLAKHFYSTLVCLIITVIAAAAINPVVTAGSLVINDGSAVIVVTVIIVAAPIVIPPVIITAVIIITVGLLCTLVFCTFLLRISLRLHPVTIIAAAAAPLIVIVRCLHLSLRSLALSVFVSNVLCDCATHQSE